MTSPVLLLPLQLQPHSRIEKCILSLLYYLYPSVRPSIHPSVHKQMLLLWLYSKCRYIMCECYNDSGIHFSGVASMITCLKMLKLVNYRCVVKNGWLMRMLVHYTQSHSASPSLTCVWYHTLVLLVNNHNKSFHVMHSPIRELQHAHCKVALSPEAECSSWCQQ